VRAARLRAAARRAYEDGRPPEHIEGFAAEWTRLRARRAAARVAALPTDPVVSGDVPMSLFDLAHDQAGIVVDTLRAGGLEPFLIDADGRRLSFGLPAGDRRRALDCLTSALGGAGWYVQWRRGHRTRRRPLDGSRPPRSLLLAEWWRLHRLHRAGEDVLVGADEAVELTFWAPGRYGRYEQLGVRGRQRFPMDSPRTVEEVDGRSYPGVAALPVGRALCRHQDPIDVVYTWVDGDDPAWRQECERWRDIEQPDRRGDHSSHPSRYRSRDELRYSLRSLWLHAGWVRNVYVVTAGQRPPWLREDERLRIVDHREIFPADWLPTFNSHSIEARLHHIDGLAEHFLYLNDDLFLGRAVTPDLFFTANGLARFVNSPAWVPLPEPELPALAVDTAARNGQALIEELFGRVVTHKLEHAPHALRRSVLAEIEERLPEVVERTARSRFRHPDDLSIPSAFAHHYAFCTGRAVPGELAFAYHWLESRYLGLLLDRLLVGRDVDAFCLNETESDGTDAATVDRRVRGFLEAYFPIASPWEA
jgi:hypothetical protein